MKITRLPTQAAKDADSIARCFAGFKARVEAGTLQAAIVVLADKDGEWYISQANTTMGDEAYAISLLQARLTQLHNDKDDATS